MKRIIFILMIASLIGCVPLSYTKYDYHAAMVQPKASPKPIYDDDEVSIMFFILDTQIAFDVLNKTDGSIKINWDDLSYITPTGQSMRVIHNGVRLVDRNAPQAPTMVAPKAKYSDSITPSENIYYISGQYGGWNESDLFPGKDKSIYNGSQFGIFLPLEIKGEKKEYNFRFIIEKIDKQEKKI